MNSSVARMWNRRDQRGAGADSLQMELPMIGTAGTANQTRRQPSQPADHGRHHRNPLRSSPRMADGVACEGERRSCPGLELLSWDSPFDGRGVRPALYRTMRTAEASAAIIGSAGPALMAAVARRAAAETMGGDGSLTIGGSIALIVIGAILPDEVRHAGNPRTDLEPSAPSMVDQAGRPDHRSCSSPARRRMTRISPGVAIEGALHRTAILTRPPPAWPSTCPDKPFGKAARPRSAQQAGPIINRTKGDH